MLILLEGIAAAPDEPLASPFDERAPHPLAAHALTALQNTLRAEFIGDVRADILDLPAGGKMFGVLVVRDHGGQIGYLRAFSGMLGGRWLIPGFVPPLFDLATRERVEREGDARVRALSDKCEALANAEDRINARVALREFQERRARVMTTMRERHRARKDERHAQRAGSAVHDAALAKESSYDSGERARAEKTFNAEEALLRAVLARWDRKLRAGERLRRMVCAELMKELHGTYRVRNAQGETRPMRELFAPSEPASGAGDCAAPKLLAYAHAHNLQPLALAELYWGAPPATGGRLSGVVYPSCRAKCGPLLPFMMEGLAVAPSQAFTPSPSSEGLHIVFEDEWIVVIDKPSGLLSVPGRHAAHKDSVLSRLRARYPSASGPLLVHRLDLDTSGLLLAVKDADSHTVLQRQFARREVKKRYAAMVEGTVDKDSGSIDFPMRPDIDDRPRQILDREHGRSALTEWQVTARFADRTRMAFFPITGRSHQLRVHAAHPLGLGAPIIGDRLYGHRGARLLLHAEAISFAHPHTGAAVSFISPAPF